MKELPVSRPMPAFFRASYLDHRGTSRHGKAAHTPRRADNWIGTPAERMDTVLG